MPSSFAAPALSTVLLVSAIVGCRPSPQSDVVRIGMMPKLMGISYFEATKQGAIEAERELGVDLEFDGPTEARAEDQAKMLDSWVAQGKDVIAVAPNDPESISRSFRTAGDAGVVVLTWDTDANPAKSGRRIFVNQAPNEAIGRTLVEVMAAGVGRDGKSLAGKYLIVSGTPTAANQNIWMEHMRETIGAKYPEIELLPHLTPGEDHRKSQEQTAETVAANPDLKGIWGITSVALPAAAKAVRDAGKAGQIYVTGLSLPSSMREYVHDGTVENFVLWDAVDLGYLTVHVANRLAQGPLPDGVYDFGRLEGIEVRDGQAILGPPLVFNKGNVDEYEF
jgi:rhamnose transport system substrate-binding protein